MLLVAWKNPTIDALAQALVAAELGGPFDLQQLSTAAERELFASLDELQASVPYATLALLGRFVHDERAEVRTQTARAIGRFVDIYPKRVDELLLVLACDPSQRVRAAAAESLADLIPRANDPWEIIEAWNAHAERAREVLEAARRSLPPPLGLY